MAQQLGILQSVLAMERRLGCPRQMDALSCDSGPGQEVPGRSI
jgi:hypothetical protein